MRARTFTVAVLLLLTAVVLPSTSSANLPRKPACSAVTATLLKSTFGFSFSSHPSSTSKQGKTVQHLGCTYRSADGDLTIAYNRYSSGQAALAHYTSVKKELIRQGNNDSSGMTVTELLPLIRLRGIGDKALRSTDGTVVEFVDGVDSVTIEHGLADLNRRTTRGMVALAGYVDHRG